MRTCTAYQVSSSMIRNAVELGVQLHMGNYFGRANQVVMLIACLGVILLSITGPIVWWKRRPKGGLGAPRELAPLRLRTMALITIGLGLMFPLAGASLAFGSYSRRRLRAVGPFQPQA